MQPIGTSPAWPEATNPSGFARLNLIGRSPAFLEVLRLVRRMADCDAIVLIQGETGTGKELAARAIHYLGVRRDAPFIAMNCGAVPDTLFENEFFGHARGAYTDAREARFGVIAQARGGTLFLDEIETMSAHGQVALLRFLQDQTYRPVGGHLVEHADVRVIAASNAPLADLAARGQFRQDLLYRLNLLSLTLPPLRERRGDAVLLAERFITRLSHQYRQPLRRLHPDTIAWLESYAWPGNVRELENLIHREFLLADDEVLRIDHPAASRRAVSGPMFEGDFREAKAQAIAEFERAYVAHVLALAGGNITQAARLCGQERSQLGKLAKKYGLERGQFAAGPVRTRTEDPKQHR